MNRGSLPRPVERVDGRRDGAAGLVAHHDNQRRVQVADRVLEAPEHVRADDVAGHADHEQVAKPLVEDELGGHSRVAARQNRRKRLLTGLQVLAPGSRFMRVAAAGPRQSGGCLP